MRAARLEALILASSTGRSQQECWEWAGTVATHGYGRYGSTYAHRLSYERTKGPIPDGLHIDHLCRNRRCINPEHLEAVTCQENFLRGEARGAVLHRENRCLRGHEMTPENTYSHGDRRGECKTCLIDNSAGDCPDCGEHFRWLAKHIKRRHTDPRERRLNRNNTSGVRGVRRSSASKLNPWQAQIMIDRRMIHLGLFPTREAAAIARLAAEHALDGPCDGD